MAQTLHKFFLIFRFFLIPASAQFKFICHFMWEAKNIICQVSDFLVSWKLWRQAQRFPYGSSTVPVQAGRETGAGNWSLGVWHVCPLTPCQSARAAWPPPSSCLLPFSAATAKVNLISARMSYSVFLAEYVSRKWCCWKSCKRKTKAEIIAYISFQQQAVQWSKWSLTWDHLTGNTCGLWKQ